MSIHLAAVPRGLTHFRMSFFLPAFPHCRGLPCPPASSPWAISARFPSRTRLARLLPLPRLFRLFSLCTFELEYALALRVRPSLRYPSLFSLSASSFFLPSLSLKGHTPSFSSSQSPSLPSWFVGSTDLSFLPSGCVLVNFALLLFSLLASLSWSACLHISMLGSLPLLLVLTELLPPSRRAAVTPAMLGRGEDCGRQRLLLGT